MFSKFIWVTLIQKQQKYKYKETLNFGLGRRILLWYEIQRLDTSSEGLIFSRMHNMQVLCPYYVKDHMKAMLHWQMWGLISQICAQWIDSKTID